jgi:hypothetical protein
MLVPGYVPVVTALVQRIGFRARGRYPEARKVALEAVEDRERWQVLRDTRQPWQDCYERRVSKMRALA